MSLECPSSPVFRTSVEQKLHSKKAAKIYRFGSPKLRQELREKFLTRIHEARQSCFQQTRRLNDIFMKDILRNELAELESDIKLQEEIYKELVDEMNEWIVEQLEEQSKQEEMYLMSLVEKDGLLCPLCQKAVLIGHTTADGRYLYKCQCSASFCFDGDEDRLRTELRLKIDLHEQHCIAGLTFFIEPQPNGKVDENSLNAFCDKCDYFCSFVSV